MNGKKARALRREKVVKQFEADSKTIYLANRAVPGQVFAANVSWFQDGSHFMAETLAGSAPIRATGKDRYTTYFSVVRHLIGDMSARGYDVVHVPAAFIARFNKHAIEDARSTVPPAPGEVTATPAVVTV